MSDETINTVTVAAEPVHGYGAATRPLTPQELRDLTPREEKYAETQEVADTLNNYFSYHPPFGDQTARYEHLRAEGRRLVGAMAVNCPPSAERTLAFRALQQAIMWANASIAINEKAP